MPRLRPAFRFGLIGLGLALAVTFLVAGRWAPELLAALAPCLAPAVVVALTFAAGAGHWLERRRLAGRWWVGALLGASTLVVATLTAALIAWAADGFGTLERYVVPSLCVAAAFGGAPSLVLGALFAHAHKSRTTCG